MLAITQGIAASESVVELPAPPAPQTPEQALSQPLAVRQDPETLRYTVHGHLVPTLFVEGTTKEEAIEEYLGALYSHFADVCRQFPEVLLASKAERVDAEASALARLVALRKKMQPIDHSPVEGLVRRVEDGTEHPAVDVGAIG